MVSKSYTEVVVVIVANGGIAMTGNRISQIYITYLWVFILRRVLRGIGKFLVVVDRLLLSYFVVVEVLN